MPKFRTVTLGCKVNQYETQYLREGLARLGYREAEQHERADLCIVNTCTVTAEADYKSRKVIRALARQNPNARIIVTGCYATRASGEVAGLPGVVAVVTDKRELPDLLRRLGLAELPLGISKFVGRHRAWVKVQDGCTMRCSYCIVPKVRPNLWSRPADQVLQEVQRLAAAGYREIVLAGVHLGHYGLDFSGGKGLKRPDLAWLVGRLALLEGDFRIRLSSLDPSEITPELIRLMAEWPHRICAHLHLPLQSGSDRVLKRMRRSYSLDFYQKQCSAIRDRSPDLAITTDLIVGFPGETEEDFAATCRAAEQLGFAHLHVFRYSRRQGTPAANMPDQVPEQVKQRRAGELGQLGQKLRNDYLKRLLGRNLQVLVQCPVDGLPNRWLGICSEYATVELEASASEEGKLIWAIAENVEGERIRASWVNG